MPSVLLASASAPAAEAAGGAPFAAAVHAELFLTLAAAFVPPPAGLSTRDWCEPLADDFADFGAQLGLDTDEAVERLRQAAAGPQADAPWLVAYSRVFLVPPVRVTLNTGVYLEGGLAGVSAQMIAQCYATAGFAPRESFRDLPDHVAMQLEFVAALLQRAAEGDADALSMAREFLAEFVSHWAEPLHQACVKASASDAAAGVFAALTDVLEQAVERAGG